MSQQNVDLIRRGLEQYLASGELEWELFDPDVEVHDHDTPDQGRYDGHEGVRRWLAEWGAAWASWNIEPEEFLDLGDWVMVPIRMKATGLGSGVEIEREDALLYNIENDRIRRVEYFNSRQQAREAVGSRE